MLKQKLFEKINVNIDLFKTFYFSFQVMLEAGQDFVTIKETVGEDGQPDLLLSMDRSKLMTVGHPAIADFLTKLQIFKSTADIVAANEVCLTFAIEVVVSIGLFLIF